METCKPFSAYLHDTAMNQARPVHRAKEIFASFGNTIKRAPIAALDG
jgi:hypothetical protein